MKPITKLEEKEGVYNLILRDQLRGGYSDPSEIYVMDDKRKILGGPLFRYADPVATHGQDHSNTVHRLSQHNVMPDGRSRANVRQVSLRASTKRGFNTRMAPSAWAPTTKAERLKDIQPFSLKGVLAFTKLRPWHVRVHTTTSVRGTAYLMARWPDKMPQYRTHTANSLSSKASLLHSAHELPLWRAECKAWPNRLDRAMHRASESSWNNTIRQAAENLLTYGLRQKNVWKNDTINFHGEPSNTIVYNGTEYYRCGCGEDGCTQGGRV